MRGGSPNKLMQLIIDLPPRAEQILANRERWSLILADRRLAEMPYRIETNAYGHILMTPPASGSHSSKQGDISYRLRQLLGGHSLPECPISTIDGVKSADVGWYSEERFAKVDGQQAFELAPEICVEVLSPSNSNAEMELKRHLYFEAGAKEVWFCEITGKMQFYLEQNIDLPQEDSQLCRSFPNKI